jgi:hypothetical protein
MFLNSALVVNTVNGDWKLEPENLALRAARHRRRNHDLRASGPELRVLRHAPRGLRARGQAFGRGFSSAQGTVSDKGEARPREVARRSVRPRCHDLRRPGRTAYYRRLLRVVREVGHGFNLDQHGGIDEAGYFDHGCSGSYVTKDLAVSSADLFPLAYVRDVHPRPHDFPQRRPGLT